MTDLNSVLLEGRLTQDPELTYTPKGQSICRFSIASNRYRKDSGEWEKTTNYFVIETWGTLADVCFEHLHKGRGVRTVGHLKQSQWKQNGVNHNRIIIVAEHVEFKPEVKKHEQEENDTKVDA